MNKMTNMNLHFRPANVDDVGRWKFRLFASDKEGEKVSDILEIVVRQYSRSRLVNHQFNIEFSFTDWDPSATRHWEWMVRIVLLYIPIKFILNCPKIPS